MRTTCKGPGWEILEYKRVLGQLRKSGALMNNDVSLIVINVSHISTYREPGHEVHGNTVFSDFL